MRTLLLLWLRLMSQATYTYEGPDGSGRIYRLDEPAPGCYVDMVVTDRSARLERWCARGCITDTECALAAPKGHDV